LSVISLAAVVDADGKKARANGRRYEVPFDITLRGALQKTPCDAAIIAVPNVYHKSCVVTALSHGLHVLCEKPLATSTRDADIIVRAAKNYKRLVKTGSNHRFFPSIEKAHQIILSGRIGKILLFRGSIGNNGDHVKNGWFWDKQTSGGGTFIDNGCHLVDIARWFMGDFVSCVGVMENVYWKKTHVEDVGTGIFITKQKQQAVITCSWTQWAGYITIEIWGDKGYILIDSKNGDKLIVGNRTNTKTKTYDVSSVSPSSYQKELEYFATCIRNHTQPIPSFSDGASVIRLIESLYTSAKEKKEILL
jgi:UDP-N-acetylglucosamine 3-dehydrogenase